MKQYTPDDYKRIVDEYCKVKNNAKITLSKPIVYNSDIFNMSRMELIDFIVNDICHNSKSIKFMLNQKDSVISFFDWCVENGYINYNALRGEAFDDDDFIYRCIDSMDLKMFNPDDVEILISKQTLNKSLYELLIRGAYEGIRNIKDFVLLKYSDVNYEDNTIIINGKPRIVSNEFLSVLTKYKKCHTFEYKQRSHIKSKDMSQYGDYILKLHQTEDINDEEYLRNVSPLVSKYFINMSKIVGYTVTYDMLYISGFIKYVKEICDSENKTPEYFNMLFFYRDSKSKSGAYIRILDFAKEYGMAGQSTTASEVRRLCLPYIVKGKILS